MSAEGKVVVVTGASQGIGAGLVRGFLERGYRVAANSRSIRPDTFEGVLAVPGDIADPVVAERVIAETVARYGRVDTLVNNAGIFVAKPFTEYSRADFENVVSVNLAGFFYVSQAAVRRMLEQGGGHIVNMTTSLVRQPMKGAAAAMASITKGGLDAVTRALAIEYADQNIRVNAIAPGIIKTPMHSPEALQALAGFHPVGRVGEVNEIVEAALYLDSAGFVTGETLHVDGGAHAGKW